MSQQPLKFDLKSLMVITDLKFTRKILVIC